MAQILAELLLHGVTVLHGKHMPAITAGRACCFFPSSAPNRAGRLQKEAETSWITWQKHTFFLYLQKKEATKQFQSSDPAIFTDDKTMREKKRKLLRFLAYCTQPAPLTHKSMRCWANTPPSWAAWKILFPGIFFHMSLIQRPVV